MTQWDNMKLSSVTSESDGRVRRNRSGHYSKIPFPRGKESGLQTELDRVYPALPVM